MKPILSVQEMAAADAETIAKVGQSTLVERAGGKVARASLRLLGGAYGRRVVVVAGKGNNGADGRVAARRLASAGARVEVVDAAPAPQSLPQCDLVIDAAYGTGFRGEYEAPSVPPGAMVLAVDIPSGVYADTGDCSPGAVKADRTVTFAALKPGHLQGEGRLRSGVVEVVDIGVPTDRARAHLIEDEDLSLLGPRPHEAHKWSAAVGIVAGSPGMVGAARLAARSALRAGAGMVRLGVRGVRVAELPQEDYVCLALSAEEGWEEGFLGELGRLKALVVGPGLGRDGTLRGALGRLLQLAPCPVVLDGDALWALGSGDDASLLLRNAKTPVVLTPHAGEYARLAGASCPADRLGASRRLSERLGVYVLLKGPTTVVAGPDGKAAVVTSGSPRLATPGTGDVLSGAIAAFLARGLPPLQAAALAAHVHGRAAGDGLAEGLVASDLPDLIARRLSALRLAD